MRLLIDNFSFSNLDKKLSQLSKEQINNIIHIVADKRRVVVANISCSSVQFWNLE